MADPAQVIYEKGKLYDLNIADMQPDPEQPRWVNSSGYRDFCTAAVNLSVW